MAAALSQLVQSGRPHLDSLVTSTTTINLAKTPVDTNTSIKPILDTVLESVRESSKRGNHVYVKQLLTDLRNLHDRYDETIQARNCCLRLFCVCRDFSIANLHELAIAIDKTELTDREMTSQQDRNPAQEPLVHEEVTTSTDGNTTQTTTIRTFNTHTATSTATAATDDDTSVTPGEPVTVTHASYVETTIVTKTDTAKTDDVAPGEPTDQAKDTVQADTKGEVAPGAEAEAREPILQQVPPQVVAAEETPASVTADDNAVKIVKTPVPATADESTVKRTKKRGVRNGNGSSPVSDQSEGIATRLRSRSRVTK